MDGKGWRPEYGISPEGVRLLGYLEALPKDERAGIADAVEQFCRAHGYLSLYDDLRGLLEREKRTTANAQRAGKVLPFRRG